MAPTSDERRELAEDEEQETPDTFDFDSSFEITCEITCEEVIKSIRESALAALARAGVERGERVVRDGD